MLKSEYFFQNDQANDEAACNYLVTWISDCGIGKCISFSDRYSAQQYGAGRL